MIQIIQGTEIKMEGKIYKCCGLWCLGKKVTDYEFKTELGTVFKRKAEYIQGLLKNKTIEKL